MKKWVFATKHEQFSNTALEKIFTKYQIVQQKFNYQSAEVTRVIGNIRISGCGYREYCDLAKHYEAMAPIFQKRLDEIIAAKNLSLGKQVA